ncbi:MAG: TetR/AcrR family transcriptional regulator [Thermoanaerobaculia bacterium]
MPRKATISGCLKHGYSDLGIQALLEATQTPKGSFYYHFSDKEDFALQVIDRYMEDVHAGLDACLCDETIPPGARIRRFFELTAQKYREEGYMGCLLDRPTFRSSNRHKNACPSGHGMAGR